MVSATSYSDSFPIRRGVLQGDITSPVYFILTLEIILCEHDKDPAGVPFGDRFVHTLDYVDDVTPEKATTRVTVITVGSKKDAYMVISVSKTKSMDVHRQEQCRPVTDEDVKAQGKFRCTHEGCHHVFNNKHELKVHVGKCCRKGVYILDKSWKCGRRLSRRCGTLRSGDTNMMRKTTRDRRSTHPCLHT